MIGDVNIFFKGTPLDEEDVFEAEVEIMIAGPHPNTIFHPRYQYLFLQNVNTDEKAMHPRLSFSS